MNTITMKMINTRGNMSDLLDENTVLDILEEFQSIIFSIDKKPLTSEEIEEFLREYLEDMSIFEE